MARGRAAVALAAAVVAALLLAGWRELWFLCDDAFITFRHAANHLRGWGYVWNPPPFEPVEGYSNFLWMVLLEGVWAATGVAPPASANVLSLLFAGGSLALAARVVARLPLPPEFERHRLALGLLVVGSGLTNHSFLTWTSSGLETSLFVFLCLAWIEALLAHGREGRVAVLARAAAAAAAAALTRPDGVLLVAGTVLVLADAGRRQGRRALLAGLPLLAVAAHLVWRRATYGAWVPNTFLAKHVGAWPEMGVRYAGSYVLAYAPWPLLALGLLAATRALRGSGGPRPALPALVVAGVLLAHAIYFTFVIGGDHFEYRVYAHLVLPMALLLLALAVRVGLPPRAVLGCLALQLLLALPIPWAQHLHTRALGRGGLDTPPGYHLAGSFPAPARPYVAAFDRLLAGLNQHQVCIRRDQHEAVWRRHTAHYPDRAEGQRVGWDQRAVIFGASVGVLGWVLPEVAVLDHYGLTDRIVARTPPPPQRRLHRLMAHDRWPPPGYVECFRPNVTIAARRVGVRPRPLGDAEIRDCQVRFSR